jgi:hypothetical protein
MISENGIWRDGPGAHFRVRLLLMMAGVLWALMVPTRAGDPGKAGAAFNRASSDLKPYACAMGDRLQKPGKEKVSATGTISYFVNSQQQIEPLRITWQYPLKIRLEQNGNSLTFDRNNPTESVLGNQKTADTVQMLLEDSIEGFFALQHDRIAGRYLGSGFRLEGAKESDPGVDLLLIAYPDIFQNKKTIHKSYWFDSRTKLLGVVAYTSPRGVTHVVIDDWRDVEGEKIPFHIERWENNKLSIQLKFDSATVSAGAEDGSLGGN